MTLTRTQHWATQEFYEFLRARAHTPFSWHANDCCTFAADAIQAFTGVDLAAEFRGKYTDQKSALIAIKAITGGTTVADAAAYCAAKAGLKELPYPLMAQRGDLVVVRDTANNNNLTVGVVHIGGRHIVVPGEKGLHYLPHRDVVRAWRVG